MVQPETEYILRDDESEAKRLSAQGVGEEIYLDENAVRAFALGDYGLGLNSEEFRN